MLKFALTVCMIISVSIQILAQKELNSFDSTEFKVNSLKGIELKIELPYVSLFLPYNFSYGVPLHFNIVNEKAISSSSTLLLKTGVNITPGVFYEDTTFNNLYSEQWAGHKVSYCSFGLNFVAEPRWYWNFQKRSLAGKTVLNSGWFLSLPFEINFPEVAILQGPTGYSGDIDPSYRSY